MLTIIGCAVGVFCFALGWWLAHRRPWDHKLGAWKLDPAVRRASWRNGYWPEPELPLTGWVRPQHRAYCLRCGKWPFHGPEIMFTATTGFMCVCFPCAMVPMPELLRYAHRVIDIKICQNFDPRITHPDQAESMAHFIEMWRGAQQCLEKWEQTRG